MKKEYENKNKIRNVPAVIAGIFLYVAWLNFPLLPVFAATDGEAKKKELLLSSFSTRFSEENLPRAHNIRLACRALDGYVLSGGAEFSFNAVVGERTKERGFLDAAVILDGEFVNGTGGGVCQASTTLYNAALLAGMGITSVHAHSLQVSYVRPSFDAMVSSSSDLCFRNEERTPVVIHTRVSDGEIEISFYGRQTGYSYRTESVTLEEILPPAPTVIEGEKDEVLRAEKKGLKSEGYLLVYRHGKRVGGRRIRRDEYKAVRGEIAKRRQTENEDSENDVIFEEESRIYP